MNDGRYCYSRGVVLDMFDDDTVVRKKRLCRRCWLHIPFLDFGAAGEMKQVAVLRHCRLDATGVSAAVVQSGRAVSRPAHFISFTHSTFSFLSFIEGQSKATTVSACLKASRLARERRDVPHSLVCFEVPRLCFVTPHKTQRRSRSSSISASRVASISVVFGLCCYSHRHLKEAEVC